jgi:polyhydroxybutyrate depolymerase
VDGSIHEASSNKWTGSAELFVEFRVLQTMNSLFLAALILAPQSEPKEITLQVGDLKRTAIVFSASAPKSEGAPLIFAFHGHGGGAKQASRSFSIHQAWPEATVIYPQGVPTPGRLTDPEGKKTGWQANPGDHGDRDLKFFDSLLDWAKKNTKVDAKRIYAMGHSNGGGFTYLTWSQRPDLFAAIAPSGASAREVRTAKPTPIMHIAGSADPLVKFAWQERTMAGIKTLNGVTSEGKTYGTHAMHYTGKNGNDFVSFIHPGGHEYPREAVPIIVKFFKEHAKK